MSFFLLVLKLLCADMRLFSSFSSAVPCRDKRRDCLSRYFDGQCGDNPKFMLINCPKSCKVCSGKCLFVIVRGALVNSQGIRCSVYG